MRTTRCACLVARYGMPVALAAALALPVQAQPPGAGPAAGPASGASATPRPGPELDATGDYRRELQACRAGRTAEDRATCLQEARSAQAARQRGQLSRAGEDYLANALMRCRPLDGVERAACEARVRGFGQSDGSVAGGGVLRWIETVVPPRGRDQLTLAPAGRDVVVPLPSR